MTTTTNLADFGSRERSMLVELLQAWQAQGLPKDFDESEVVPMMNLGSGFVFLTNADFQVAMLNGETLESFYTSPYEGKEGFFDDLKGEFEDMHHEDQEWFRDVAKGINREDELPQVEEDEESDPE
jgi:hypothetical protein